MWQRSCGLAFQPSLGPLGRLVLFSPMSAVIDVFLVLASLRPHPLLWHALCRLSPVDTRRPASVGLVGIEWLRRDPGQLGWLSCWRAALGTGLGGQAGGHKPDWPSAAAALPQPLSTAPRGLVTPGTAHPGPGSPSLWRNSTYLLSLCPCD